MNTSNLWLKNTLKRKNKLWLLFHFIVSLGLFSYSFTYWEDTGLGESPSLPIGYGQRIYSPDYAWTTFYPDLEKAKLNKDELIIDSFIVQKDILCAVVSHDNSNSPKYDFIVCDLKKKTNKTFLNETDYNEYAQVNNLPQRELFSTFKHQYCNYLNARPKWKKWLLPR